MAAHKSITMSDIANRLNISTVSVSKALKNKEGISDALREKILDTAEEMGYRYHLPKKELSVPDGKNIGILVSERYLQSKQAFYWEICHQINKVLNVNNYFGIIETISTGVETELEIPQVIGTNKVDGIIVLGQISPAYLTLLSDSALPIVYTDFYLDDMEYDTITTDNFYSAYLITNYLIKNGHQQIGFLGDIHATSSILDRYLGYSKALVEHRLPMRQEWLLNDRSSEGILAAPQLPSQLPTAFVCNCDQAAYLLCEKLKSESFKVPEEVSLVGFDNNVFAEICAPKLTTVAVDIRSLASSTVTSLITKISKNNISVRRKVIPGKLVIRDSVRAIV